MPEPALCDIPPKAGRDASKGAVCLTIGDPTGIGPEIMAKFLNGLGPADFAAAGGLRVYGDIANLVRTAEQLALRLPENNAIDYENTAANDKAPGRVAYDSLETAVSAIHAGQGRLLVTGPISKDNLQAAGVHFSGHTEILQQLARKLYGQPYQSDMLFLYKQFRMLLLTRHVPLKKVHETLSVRGIMHSMGSLITFLREHVGIASPRLCVLGVNPHAGELDGEEEERFLLPALKLLSEKYELGIEPPVAADAAFRHFDMQRLHADARLDYDAYVAAYHDQGLIPFKMVAGLSAVNVTIGLPFLRTSVSHGTAPDIAGQGIADPASLIAAYQAALELTKTQSALA